MTGDSISKSWMGLKNQEYKFHSIRLAIETPFGLKLTRIKKTHWIVK
jgi:hypothetical protein